MNNTLFLLQVDKLVQSLRVFSIHSEADRIEDIVNDRAIWDRMIIRLKIELSNLLAYSTLPINIRLSTEELSKTIESEESSSYESLVYNPARELAKEAGRHGLYDWQSQVEQLISNSASSTEIFMGLIWHINELLKNSECLTEDFISRATTLRNSLQTSLNSAVDDHK